MNKLNLKISKLKRKYRKSFYNNFWLLTLTGCKNYLALRRYHNFAKGKRCFILGNGPSLLKCDVTKLKNEITIGSNGIFLIFNQLGFKPTFLTVEDGLVAEDRAIEINSIKGLIKIFPYDLSNFLKQDKYTIYCNFVRRFKKKPKFSPNLAKKAFWGGTVSYLNLQLAYFIGCKEIYLIGFDHNYAIKDKIEEDVIISSRFDENHFHADYFGPGYRWHDPKVWRMEIAYNIAKEFLERNQIKVINATIGGNLEVFQKIDYNKLFN